jgi:hypothetical protein
MMSCFRDGGGNSDIFVRHPWTLIGPVVLAVVRRRDQASSLKQQIKRVFAFLVPCWRVEGRSPMYSWKEYQSVSCFPKGVAGRLGVRLSKRMRSMLVIARRLLPKKSGEMPRRQPRAGSEKPLQAGRRRVRCWAQGFEEGGEMWAGVKRACWVLN